MANILVFAGTGEGRGLVEELLRRGANVSASVATPYGRSLLPKEIQVFTNRLDADGMVSLLQNIRFDCVIDTTHPFAVEATRNIFAACQSCKIPYLRMVRPQQESTGCMFVETSEKAAEILRATTGNVLMTIGSNQLDQFTSIPNYQSRLFPRVLPGRESIERCLDLGFPVSNIIAMQGPFTREMNCAMIRQIGASMLVTKESGTAGGFREKVEAARDTGIPVVVIGRPIEENGLSQAQILERLEREYKLHPVPVRDTAAPLVPVFANVSRDHILLFGGGSCAYRCAKALKGAAADLKIIAPHCDERILQLGVEVVARSYQCDDFGDATLVLAATDNADIDHSICTQASAKGISSYVIGKAEENRIHFATTIYQGDYAIGIHSKSGKGEQTLARKVADLLLPKKETQEEAQ